MSIGILAILIALCLFNQRERSYRVSDGSFQQQCLDRLCKCKWHVEYPFSFGQRQKQLNNVHNVFFLLLSNRMNRAVVSIITYFAINTTANRIGHGRPTNNILVNCDLSEDGTRCHISEPLHIKAGDRLEFNMESNSQANRIQQLSVTYEATIPFIPHSIFERFANLEQLTMSTGIRVLHYDDFEHARNLRNLTLSDNRLEHIRQGDFAQARNLIELNLDGNEILHLDNYAFHGLANLYYMSLNKNRLITLKSHVFSGVPHLMDLRLANNEIEVLEPGVFDLPDLMFLYLANNQLKTIPDDCFRNTQLVGLDLRSNQLTQIGESVYELRMLKKLLLAGNRQITDLNMKRLSEIRHLIILMD